jgi:pimeloyl-ACP methyl ester carboxylesterase
MVLLPPPNLGARCWPLWVRTNRAPSTFPASGCRPPGFGFTRWAYKDWLVGELEKEADPVHLVAHDQGAIIGQGLVLERPALVASFVFGDAVADDDYHWHTEARVFQTAELGERSVAGMAAMTVKEWASMLESYGGAPPEYAEEMARGMDARMYEAMLKLYRSEPSMADWAIDPDRTYPPSLILWGNRDPGQDPSFGRRAAEAYGGRFAEIDSGHFWMLERPREAAQLIRAFW